MVYKRFSASEDFVLGAPSTSNIGSWVVHVVINSGTFSMTPKGRLAGATRPEATVAMATSELTALHYKSVTTGSITAGSTPITAEGIYVIPADGVDVVLSGAPTGGTTDIYAIPLNG